MSDWYLKDPSGAPSGPHATQAVLQWIAAGQVTGSTPICAVGANRWMTVAEVPALQSALTGRVSQAPSQPPGGAKTGASSVQLGGAAAPGSTGAHKELPASVANIKIGEMGKATMAIPSLM